MSNIIDPLKDIYSNFDLAAVKRLGEIYDRNVVFRDPLHELDGLDDMQDYFLKLSETIDYCKFSFGDELVSENKAYLSWKMFFRHRQLNRGNEIVLRGVSHIEFAEKIVYHEDYYDMGEMVYEHVPIFGRTVRWLKRRMLG